MLQHINAAPNTAWPTSDNVAKTLTAAQIQNLMSQLSAGGTLAAEPASAMLALIAQNGVTPQLAAALTLLQQQGGDDNALAAGLTQLLAQYGDSASSDTHAVKDLARWLGTQLSQLPEGVKGGVVEKQSATLLRQLSQGNLSDQVKNTLARVLQEMRQSGAPLTQSQVDDKLQTLLQQVRQEVNAQGQSQDPQLAKNLTEFALRLHQQLNEDAARLMPSGYPINARHQGEQQQRQQQHAADEEEEQESTAGVAGSRASLKAFSLSVADPFSSADASVTAQPASLVIGKNTIAATTTTGASGLSLYQGDSVFSYGLNVLFTFMQMLSDQANSSYADMQKNSSVSRDAQKYASAVDGVLANVAAKGDSSATGELSPDVEKYIRDNHLEISGVCGYNKDGVWELNEGIDLKKCDQGQLTAIKGALDNVANRASDFISTAQLQLQKMMQTYNVCVSLINSLQTMLADMNKTIAQGIR